MDLALYNILLYSQQVISNLNYVQDRLILTVALQTLLLNLPIVHLDAIMINIPRL